VSEGLITLLLVITLLVLLATGAPIAFCVGGTALIFAMFLWGANSLMIVATQTFGVMQNIILVAVPLFVLMASFLRSSDIADDLYGLMYNIFGRLNGGLAIATVLVCMLFAAMSGISGAATVTMGIVALPAMLKRGYDKSIALGCIGAGGALGVLIPPSVTMIILGVILEVSVGQLFAGGVFPGILLGLLFIIYIVIRSYIQPELAPPLPPEERVGFKAIVPQFKALVLPILLVFAVLGSIFTGMATPTEAAAVGAFGAMMCVALKRKLTIAFIWNSATETMKVTVIVMWIAVGAIWLSSIYAAIGGPVFINQALQSLGVNRWFVLIGMQLILILLGMVLDPLGIMFLTVPIFAPIITQLGFDSLWFGILFIVNLEMSYLTPPFGYNLFYLKGVAPKGVTMGDIYRSVGPFVLLQLLGLIICMAFPPIVTALPNIIFG